MLMVESKTRILLANSQSKEIGKIGLFDLVKTTDDRIRPVKAIFQRDVDSILDITAYGKHNLKCTWDQVIQTSRGLILAKDLTLEDAVILKLVGGVVPVSHQVSKIKTREFPYKVFSLEIEEKLPYMGNFFCLIGL